jgi:dolichol-phosphate mannosyltransferase
VLVVDDASPDGTGDLVEAWARREPGRVHLIRRPGKMGLGSAYITGFRAALQRGAAAIGQMDADFSHSPAYVPGFCERLDDAEAVFGSRYVPGGSVDERWERGRVLLSRFGNIYARAILGLRVRDTTGGFRLWRGEALARFPLERVKSDGYVFQVEMAYIAQRLGLRSVELPIHFEDRRIGQSKMSFRIQVEAALRVWELPIRYRDLRRAHRG